MTMTPERLRRLVKHRDRLERLQQLRLAGAQRKRAERERALADSRGRRVALLDAELPTGPVDIDSLVSGAVHLVALDREIDARQAAVAHSDGEVALERGNLLERRRDLKAVETLLDRRLEEQRALEMRAEAKRIDELAAQRWWARVSSGEVSQGSGARQMEEQQ